MVTDLFASLASILVDNGKGGGGRLGREGFNSLIGIVTAICGNVLISIALNTQRYAHIKLNEQAAERRRLLRRAERRNMESSGHVGSNGQSGQNSGNGRDAKERLQRIQRDYKSKDGRQNGNYPRSSSGDDESDEQRPLLDGYQTPDERVEDESDSNSNAKQDEEASQKSYLKSPYWWAGIIMMTVGEAGNFLAYGFAPASIVSPLGVVAIISNCIIAPIFMKEPFRWRDFFGVVVAVAGAVTVVLSASESNPRLGPHEIWDLIARWEFETYLGITVFVIICLMWASNKYGQKSVFIDLGLVGLFGKYFRNFSCPDANDTRWLHCSFHERRCITSLIHLVQSTYFPRILPPGCNPIWHCRHANQIHQQSSPTIRFHTSHSDSICHVHSFSNSGKCGSISRFRKD